MKITNIIKETALEMANTFLGDVSSLSIYSDCDGIVEDCCYEEEMFEVYHGISKVVLEPIDKKLEFVVKLPIYGSVDIDSSRGCTALYEKREECVCEGDTFNCQYEDCEFYDEDKVTYNNEYECANSDNGNDYCEAEVRYYAEAKKKRLEKFFAETVYIGKSESGLPVYIQEKVPYADGEKGKNSLSEKSKISFKKIAKKRPQYTNVLPEAFSKTILDVYGVKSFVKLVDFLIDQEIDGDFHSQNVGFTEDQKPILFDYSDYKS